jgi:hypothetical protein
VGGLEAVAAFGEEFHSCERASCGGRAFDCQRCQLPINRAYKASDETTLSLEALRIVSPLLFLASPSPFTPRLASRKDMHTDLEHGSSQHFIDSIIEEKVSQGI